MIGLSGPFVIPFLPLFVWRFARERNADTLAALAVATTCAAIQCYFVTTTGTGYFAQPGPFSPGKLLTVAGSRFVVWPLLGPHVASTLSWPALRWIGIGFIALLFAWALRPHPRRILRANSWWPSD